MINLLISLGSATAAFVLGMVVAGSWIAGLLPAILVLAIVYFVLARRTSNKLQALMEQAGKAIQRQKIAEARRVLEAGRPLGRWQFLVEGQIEAQLGALAYLERDWGKARAHLDRAFSRNWMAQGMLAAMDLREKNAQVGIERLEKASGFAKKESLFWGLYAYILVENKQQDKALEVLARGLKVMPDNEPLKDLQKAISNKRRKLKMGTMFGNNWYTFFPEQFPVRRYQNAALQGRGFPQPRR
jgi:tetratricopeptide (TPR) repeat protein